MELKLFDILLLLVLAIAIALIIGMNVLYVVDKKLSDVKINVPPCPAPKCPVPNVYIKTNDNQIYKVETEMINNNINKKVYDGLPQKYTTMNSRSNDGLLLNQKNVVASNPQEMQNNEKKIEGYVNTVAVNNVNKSNEDSNEINDTGNPYSVKNTIVNKDTLPLVITADNDKKKLLLRQGYNAAADEKPNRGQDIMYPRATDILRYNGQGCYLGTDNRNIRKVKTVEKSFQPQCQASISTDQTNRYKMSYIDANGIVTDRNVSVYVPTLYMGRDPYIQGFNYANASLEIPADVDQIGSIPVNDYDGEPVPISSFMDDNFSKLP